VSGDDVRHGTIAGFGAGCREDCCRLVRNAYERNRRKYRAVLGIERRVSSVGTQRRLRALMALGWTSATISARCGWTTPQAVTELLTSRKFVFLTTHQTIARVYDELSMTLGPSEKNRREARRKGWPPPLAWDNIDDHDETPRGLPSPTRKERSEFMAADWDHLRRQGYTRRLAAERMGVSKKRLEKAIERAGRRMQEAS
jgi:hypothetical protein